MSDYDCETKEFLHISLSREFRVFVKMGGTLCGEYTQHTCVTPAATVTLISSSSTLMTRAGSPRSNSDGSSLVSAAKVSVLFGVHGISDTHTYIYIASISLSILYPLSSRMLPRRRHMYAYAYLTAIFTPSFSFEQKKPSFHECPSPVETYQGHNEPDSTDMRVSTYQSPWTRFCLVVFTARWWCCFWFPKNLNG